MNLQQQLEDEAIYIIREVASQFERLALLFSGGKDSIVLLHLCQKVFAPAAVPFPLVHIDTSHNFIETLQTRNHLVAKYGVQLEEDLVKNSIDRGRPSLRFSNQSSGYSQTSVLI